MTSSHAHSAMQTGYRPTTEQASFGQGARFTTNVRCKAALLPGAVGQEQRSEAPNAQVPGTRVLVVSDDPAWHRQLSDHFHGSDFGIATASGAYDMTQALATERISMVLIARQFDQADGFDWVRKLRASSDLPVVMTSPGCDEEEDRVLGLKIGADDYLGGSFSGRELLARMRAVLRRAARTPREDALTGSVKAAMPLRFGQWTLHRRTRRLTDGAGEPVVLTKSEYALLAAFVDAPQRPLSREHLLKATRVHEDVFDRSIDVQVLRLRRKLGTDPTLPSVIQAERGVGYIFTLPVENAWPPQASGLKQ